MLRGRSQQTHLLPKRRLRGQARNGCHHPAVTQTALVQVTSANAIHKQARVFAYFLEVKQKDGKTKFGSTNPICV